MKLSFIIPVYNVEAYLEECINSIVQQWNEDCEIILVDDGSTDRSAMLCDIAAERYAAIRVIHKENGGHSSARNAGLDVAEGEYIAFIDSDDRLADGCINKLIEWISRDGADLCFMEAVKFYPDGHQEAMGDRIEQRHVAGQDKNSVLDYIASRPKYPGSACTKVYRRAYLEDNRLCFPTDRQHGEDLKFVLQCLLKAEAYDALEIPYYEYRQNREGSISHMLSRKSFFDLGLFITETISLLTYEMKAKDTVCRNLMSIAAYEYSIMLWQYSRLDHVDQTDAMIFLRENQWVLQFGKTRRIKAINTLSKVIGLELTSRLLDFYMSHR